MFMGLGIVCVRVCVQVCVLCCFGLCLLMQLLQMPGVIRACHSFFACCSLLLLPLPKPISHFGRLCCTCECT